MADRNDEIKIEAMSEFPNYGKIAFVIRIVDGGAITKFSDSRLAKDTYLYEKKSGNKNISYQERLCCVTEKYPGEKKEKIAERIVKQLKLHNAKIKK
jgi:hypothetical protein